MNEEGVVGVAELEGDHAGSVAAQVTLALGAEFAAHVGGERALAPGHRGLIEFHVALAADEGELGRIENRRLARAVHADEVRRAVAGDGRVLEEVPVDEADAGEGFHDQLVR